MAQSWETGSDRLWTGHWADLAALGQCDPVLALAATRAFVLTGEELAGVGVTRARTRTNIARELWTPAGHGYVAPVTAPSERHLHALQAASAGRRRPADAIGGASAAVLHGMPVLRLPDRPRLTLREESLGRGRRSTATSFTGWLPDDEITSWFGVAVATAARTLVDLARHDRFDGIMAADAALRMGLVSDAEIRTALGGATGWPGVRQAREVLALADPLAESPLESVTRLRVHDEGFPPPTLQFWIAGYRVDLCWPELRLVLEVDGRQKYAGADPDYLWREKQRENAIRRSGYRVERVIARDVYQNWPATADHLRPLLRPVVTPVPAPSSPHEARLARRVG